jgi:hypothetical protein
MVPPMVAIVRSYHRRENMTVEDEIRKAASSFGKKEFKRQDLVNRIQRRNPDRPDNSVFPSDHCVNPAMGRQPIGSEHKGKFLRRTGHGLYENK